MTITSNDNQWIKELRKLASPHGRGKSVLFAAEGEDLVELALANGWSPAAVLVREGSGLQGEEVDAEVLDSVSGLGSGTRMIGIFERHYAPKALGETVVHLSGVRDPGNVGTIVRSAHALGATTVSIGPGSADVFSAKAVRASMGAVFALPVVECEDLSQLPGILVGLDSGGESTQFPEGAVTIVVGAERTGLPAEVAAACDVLWSIPMVEGAESVNAAVAASIALYAANRIQSNA